MRYIKTMVIEHNSTCQNWDVAGYCIIYGDNNYIYIYHTRNITDQQYNGCLKARGQHPKVVLLCAGNG